jgi:Fe-Mn family superoxide dismutase
MEKRTFLKTGFLLSFGAFAAPYLQSCSSTTATGMRSRKAPDITRTRSEAFKLPPLPYEPAALEPHIDRQTMEIHHGRHHQAYVNNLNDAVQNTAYAKYELDDLLMRVTGTDADRKIRNNAGGHWNHSLFWQILAPKGGGQPSGALASAINTAFGSYAKFQEQFTNAAKNVFGSGWAWLSVGADRKLFVSSTPNQDNPLMWQIVGQTGTPILGLDVWEHAYYLKYQNKRPDYVTAFYNVINWEEVARRYDMAMK